MKRTAILTAVLLTALAPLAQATPAVMKEAKAKNPGTTYNCNTCHSKLPASKDNLTDEGKKWVK